MHVTVLGAGTMGHGIAQVTATAGHDVVVRDIESEYVEEGITAIEDNLEGGVERDKLTREEADATLSQIEGTTDLEAALEGADVVIEAVPEDLELKQRTLEDVEAVVDEETIVATNTSSLSVTEIASAADHDDRVIGLHFFNPVHVMELVEIVVPEQASEATVASAHEFVADVEKTPVEVTDSPGFASSRLGVALGVEAMRMVEEGVADPRDVDTAMELGYNHPMGPIELGDVVGLDVRLDILEYLREELGERFRPPQALKRKVRAGNLGKKTGEGFYVWEDGEIVGVSGGEGDE
ncbi:3-hydroxyacyl-CoA dehydrogenase family protein [Natronobacterium gregoryi]|uniref:3-hydroxyacyl-CoA dehydrogenase n=2 Tax=Natronobacterium gregoryi TaxID=44930 RepID=L0AHD1_NATGS|nr:3-hydroxyacyl-CoA dehydrogenase family protein [Natronobacterium gregoryi]AFZ72480.1 3-hydroxyacyl-CoA dehydrogenase [Natronobacterium gregoryi SP2]ELY74352.1 3-hydroxyacyl-CoA dehydrogenase [Natronobacterium gregoryi SP2]PLK21451.1 3-hydroxybutyryl-CoA dehydrogenase [Natronobacterium gregoryi SP2]SFI77501.1 3-hydroxyacyl-CoA dehydrogenase [Natronobacterium gregoryi]